MNGETKKIVEQDRRWRWMGKQKKLLNKIEDEWGNKMLAHTTVP